MRSVLVLFLIFLNCAPNTKSTEQPGVENKIIGTWYIIRNDSAYSEAIITDSLIWGYSNPAGLHDYRYSIIKDTVAIFHKESRTFKLHLHDVSDTSFTLENQFIRTVYYRMNNKFDLHDVENKNFNEIAAYFYGFNEREQIYKLRNGLVPSHED
jgi:hypothetical protein